MRFKQENTRLMSETEEACVGFEGHVFSGRGSG